MTMPLIDNEPDLGSSSITRDKGLTPMKALRYLDTSLII